MAEAAAPVGVPRPRRRWALAAGIALVLAAAMLCWPWVRVERNLNAARQSLAQGDPAAALDPLQRAEQTRPNRADVQYLLAVAHRRSGRLDRFQAHLFRARELGYPPDDVQRQEWLAVAQSGNVGKVEGRLLKAIECGVADDVAEEIYEAIVRGHLAAFRFRDAWLGLDMWLQWRPDAPQARLMRATLYEEMGEIQSAVEDYRATLARLADNRLARIHLGQLMLGQGQIEEAKEQFLACVAADPDDADALLGAARCARAQQENGKARGFLDAALAGEMPARERAEVLAELGQLLLDEGKVPESVEALSQAVALAHAEGPIHHKLSLALFRAGQAERAEFHGQRAQQIRRKQNRLIVIRRSIMEKPGDADLRCEAGTIMIEEGFVDEGLGWLLSALGCDSGHRKTHQILADYYAQAGNPQLAAHHRLLAASSPGPVQTPKPK
jgi:tetratricopeptide (TPR) repeat protein